MLGQFLVIILIKTWGIRWIIVKFWLKTIWDLIKAKSFCFGLTVFIKILHVFHLWDWIRISSLVSGNQFSRKFKSLNYNPSFKYQSNISKHVQYQFLQPWDSLVKICRKYDLHFVFIMVNMFQYFFFFFTCSHRLAFYVELTEKDLRR